MFNHKLIELLDEEENIFKENLIKILNKSIEGLNEIINEINNLKQKDFYLNLSYYHINNLKTNLNYIQEQFDGNMKLILQDIQENIQILKENFNEKNELINQIDLFFNNISKDILLKKIYSSIGLFDQIDSIISLFTGIGVLGIVPFRTTFIINNTASEIMFIDKLEELNKKFHFIIKFLQNNQNKQIQILNQYFNNLKTH